MVHALSVPRYRYTVNAHDVITAVSPNWLAFAQENGVAGPYGTGRAGTVPLALYRRFPNHPPLSSRASTRSHERPSNHAAISLRLAGGAAYMRLEISCKPQGSIQFEGLLERVEPTEWFKGVDSHAPRSRDSLTLCSFCKRALVEPRGWLEIEDAISRLHLFETRNPHSFAMRSVPIVWLRPMSCHCRATIVTRPVVPWPCENR